MRRELYEDYHGDPTVNPTLHYDSILSAAKEPESVSSNLTMGVI